MKSSRPRFSGAFLLATWFGCGLAPKAPGTFGTLGAFAVAVPLILLRAPAWAFAVLTLGAIYPAIRASTIVAAESGLKDPQIVVVDEVLGLWLTLAGAARYNWKCAFLAFGLFRLFDIWKPWPIRRLERLPAGTGIVMDDIMAGIYGAFVLRLLGSIEIY